MAYIRSERNFAGLGTIIQRYKKVPNVYKVRVMNNHQNVYSALMVWNGDSIKTMAEIGDKLYVRFALREVTRKALRIHARKFIGG